jgi:hypothetical protein
MQALLSLEDLAVPDQDRFERGFAPGWRKVYRLAKGAIASEAEIADACISALAHCLRQSGGCASLQDLVNVLQSFAQHRATPPSPSVACGHALTEAFEALRRIERQQGGHRVTKVAVHAAMPILERSSREGNALHSETGLIRALAEQTCMSLVDHHFFGRARAYLVGERFSSFHDRNLLSVGVFLGNAHGNFSAAPRDTGRNGSTRWRKPAGDRGGICSDVPDACGRMGKVPPRLPHDDNVKADIHGARA